MAKKITIYTRTTCSYCVQVKRLLDMKGKTYDVINLDEDLAAEAAIIAKSGARTVPVVTVTDDAGDEQVASIGWNPGALLSAVA
ncbi:TPA: glutaredoxin [Candidatus Saccharibacteria bacterium]|nr:glutaredoxin [Candidatus Saccharibacteria bacterium]HRK41150.1 glutaredoxin [Candidatus Saccharibacteria bacterium]